MIGLGLGRELLNEARLTDAACRDDSNPLPQAQSEQRIDCADAGGNDLRRRHAFERSWNGSSERSASSRADRLSTIDGRPKRIYCAAGESVADGNRSALTKGIDPCAKRDCRNRVERTEEDARLVDGNNFG